MQWGPSSEVRLSFSRLCPVESWALQGQRQQSLGVNLFQCFLILMLKVLPNRQMEHFLFMLLVSSHWAPLWEMEVCHLYNLGFIRLWLGASGAVFSSGWTSPVTPASQRARAPYLWASWWSLTLASVYSEVYYLFVVSGYLKLDVIF